MTKAAILLLNGGLIPVLPGSEVTQARFPILGVAQRSRQYRFSSSRWRNMALVWSINGC